MIKSKKYEYLIILQNRLENLAKEKKIALFNFTYMPDTYPENFSDAHHGDPIVYKKITEKISNVKNQFYE